MLNKHYTIEGITEPIVIVEEEQYGDDGIESTVKYRWYTIYIEPQLCDCVDCDKSHWHNYYIDDINTKTIHTSTEPTHDKALEAAVRYIELNFFNNNNL